MGSNEKSKDFSEEILEILDDVDKELSKVFYELMSGKVSFKKRMLLREKTILLTKKVYNSLMDKADKTEKDIKDYDNLCIKYKKISNISFAIRMVGVMFLFIKPLLSLGIQLVGIFMHHHAIKQMNEFDEPKADYTKEVLEKANSLNILIGNCSRRLSLDIEVISDKDDEELFDKMDIANNIINEYVKTNSIPNEIDDITKEILIKMLQKDLKVNSNDMQYLLNEASLKIKEEEKKLLLKS